MKILFSTFSSNAQGSVGYVVTEADFTCIKKLRVSALPKYLAFSEEKSIQYIADYGATVPLHSLKEIVKILEEK